ncbi:MAG: isocitrate/isopropylmalate family dehydrogenase [Bryobacteraceae bacterium]
MLEALGFQARWRELPAGERVRSQAGSVLPAETLETICALGVALKAPLAAPRCTGGVAVERNGASRRYPSVNNALRRELGLYVNVRPVRGWKPSRDVTPGWIW